MTRISMRLCAAAAALMTLGGGLVAAAAPAHAQAGREVNGRNLASASFAQGAFERQPDGNWVERNAQGRVTDTFRETNRDDWSVYLRKNGVAHDIQIDVHRMMVTFAANGGPRRDLYKILEARSSSGYVKSATPIVAIPPAQLPRPTAVNFYNVEVGPIWNQADADTKCGDMAEALRLDWTGQWRTTIQGRMSVCEVRVPRRGGRDDDGWRDRDRDRGRSAIRNIEVGPIWNQRDAETKCAAKAREMRAEWTGQWRTTVQGRMSECELRFD